VIAITTVSNRVFAIEVVVEWTFFIVSIFAIQLSEHCSQATF